MLYLLDANVLIRAHEDYYPLDRVPQFWEWLEATGQADVAKLPFEIYDEISQSDGPLADWIKQQNIKEALQFEEEATQAHIQQVIDDGYAPDLTDDEIEKIGRDPFLIAYGLVDEGRVIVTKEVSKPGRQRANRHIPDVCETVGVNWSTDFSFFRDAGFSTAP